MATALETKYKTSAALEKAIAKYWAKIDETAEVPSEHGLASHLGVTRAKLQAQTRDGHDDEYTEIVRMAYDELMVRYLQLLKTGDKNMSSVVIFMLKQPIFGGYQDRVEQKSDSTVSIVFGKGVDESCFK